MFEFWDGIPRSKHTWNNKTWMGILRWIQKWRPDIFGYFSLDVTARYGWIWMLVGNFRKSLLFKCLRVQFCDRPWDCLPGCYCIKSSQKIILGIISSGTQFLSYEPAKHSSLFGPKTGSGLRNSMNHVILSWHGNFMKLPVLAKKTQGMIGLL